jgi:hypothetical protein
MRSLEKRRKIEKGIYVSKQQSNQKPHHEISKKSMLPIRSVNFEECIFHFFWENVV